MYRRLVDDIENSPDYTRYDGSSYDDHEDYFADYEGGGKVVKKGKSFDKDYTPTQDDNFNKLKVPSKKKKKNSKKAHKIGDEVDENETEFTEKVLPKGTPGRKSFAMLPREKKKFWRPEAMALRKMFPITGTIHFCFLMSDIFIYGDILMSIIDAILTWLDFYNYMILNKITIGIEIIIHILVCLNSITHIQAGLQDEDTSKTVVVIFILQFFITYPTICVLMGKRLKAHYSQ